MVFLKTIINFLKEYDMSLDDLLKALGLFGSAVAFIWSAIAGIKTVQETAKDKRDKQISEYISLFTDTDRVKRISGVNGLVQHATLVFNELFYLCAIEQDPFIREFIQEALEEVCLIKKADCIKYNKFLVQYCLKHDILILKMDKKNKEEIFEILGKGNTKKQIEMEINSRKSGVLYNGHTKIGNYMTLSSQLLAKSLKQAVGEDLYGILFIDSNLDKAYWRKCELKNAVLLYNIGRHTRGEKIEIKEVYLASNDFYGSEFKKLVCHKIWATNINLQNSYFTKLLIQGTNDIQEDKDVVVCTVKSKFTNMNLNNSQFISSHLEQCDIISAKLRQCKLTDSSFDTVYCKDNSFAGTNFRKCSFRNTNFYSSNFFIESFRQYTRKTYYKTGRNAYKRTTGPLFCKFNDCIFDNVKWGGSNLRNTKFINCTFKDVNFAGADLEDTLLDHCTFDIGVNFVGAKNIDKIVVKGEEPLCLTETKQKEKSGDKRG